MIQKAFTILWGQHNRHQRVSMIHRRFGSYPSLGWTECLNSFRPPCCSLSSGSISWRKHSIWGLSVYVWRRWWQPTPLLLPGKSLGQRGWVDYRPWGRKESDMTEWPHFLSLSLLQWYQLYRVHFPISIHRTQDSNVYKSTIYCRKIQYSNSINHNVNHNQGLPHSKESELIWCDFPIPLSL